MRIPQGGLAVSGQHQRSRIDNPIGMDRGEGVEGFLTLFQLSSKPLRQPYSVASAALVDSLASQCSKDLGSDVISWRNTPRKQFGGVTETPAREECGNF